MSKIHYFQRYSSVENAVTNNTLQLLARIYDYSSSRASRLLTDITGAVIEIGIEINQQVRLQASVPDGAIIQRSFKILIESKVDSGVSIDQIIRHIESFSDESQQILLLLTRHKIEAEVESKISELIQKSNPRVVFSNVTYEMICNAIKGIFADYEYEMLRIVEDYIEYCNDEDLFDQSKYFLRIVPCGKSIDINSKYGIYFHPSDRGYTKHRYVGIYKDKTVQFIWEIDCVYDVDYEGGQIHKELVQGRVTNEYDKMLVDIIKEAEIKCGYNISSGHRFFCGNPIRTNFIKVTSGGIQGARLINLKEVIGEYSNASEVAEKLARKTWG